MHQNDVSERYFGNTCFKAQKTDVFYFFLENGKKLKFQKFQK